MFGGDLKIVDKLPDSLQPSKDGVLSSKRIFPKEDLKGGLILMLAILEVWIWAGELVKIIEEKIDLVLEVVGHACYLIIMFDQFFMLAFLISFYWILAKKSENSDSIFKLLKQGEV